MSLQQNIIDREENTPSTVNTLGITEHAASFISAEVHLFRTILTIMSKDSFDQLSPDLQQLLQEAPQ